MAQQLVPLTNNPNQSLLVNLNVDGKSVSRLLRLHYNDLAGYWVLGISDAFGNLLLDSLPLVGGEAPAGNLLGQFAYLGIGGITVVNASGVPQDYPNNTNLGSDFLLIWYNSKTT